MNVKVAPETVVKKAGETKKVNMEFKKELASSETVSSVSDTTITPASELTAVPATSGTIVQYTIASGLDEKAFTASADTDTLTSASHGYSNNHPIHVMEDNAKNLPGGLSATKQYYVINTATDTLQLALTIGGSAVSITSDGQGTMGVDYTVTSTIATSESQTIIGEGVCQVRD